MRNAGSQLTRRAKLLAVTAVAFSVCGFAGSIHAADPSAPGQSSAPVFDGGKSTWHDDFVRYDFLMDKETFEITPFTRPDNERFGVGTPPTGKLRCIVVVPKNPASGNPWSWQACYWDHRPQTEDQHGAGTTASIEGSTAAYDLNWQALAKKWDCALWGSTYHVLNEKIDISPSIVSVNSVGLKSQPSAAASVQ